VCALDCSQPDLRLSPVKHSGAKLVIPGVQRLWVSRISDPRDLDLLDLGTYQDIPILAAADALRRVEAQK
jgi:hypothetical protein